MNKLTKQLNQEEVIEFMYDYIENEQEYSYSDSFRGFVHDGIFFMYTTHSSNKHTVMNSCSGIHLTELTQGHSLGMEIDSRLRRIVVNGNLIWFDKYDMGTVTYDKNDGLMSNDYNGHWSNYFEDGAVYEANIIGSSTDFIDVPNWNYRVYIDNYVQLTQIPPYEWISDITKKESISVTDTLKLPDTLSFKIVTTGDRYNYQPSSVIDVTIGLMSNKENYVYKVHSDLNKYHDEDTHHVLSQLVKSLLLEY